MKNHIREKNTNFHFMTSGVKTIDLGSNLIGKRYRGTRVILLYALYAAVLNEDVIRNYITCCFPDSESNV